MKTRVVILNWNGEEMLRRFLGGVVDSVPTGVEVVVADNGSTDSSCRYVEEHHPAVRLIRLDRNYGFAEGYNRALGALDGDLFVLLNSDVETPKGWLEPLVEAMEQNPELGAVAPKLRSWREREVFEYAGASGGFIDYLGYPFCRGRILQSLERDRGQYDDPRDCFWVSGAAFCCRATTFRALGGFDPRFFAHMEEIDLCWRMQLQGWRVRVIPQSVVYHVGGATLAVDSPLKIYLNHRNNLRMLFKCASPGQRLTVAVVRPFTDLLAALSYLMQGRGAAFGAVFRAWRDFLGEHTLLARQRHEIRSQRRKNPTGIYRGSMLLRYLFGGRTFGKMM